MPVVSSRVEFASAGFRDDDGSTGTCHHQLFQRLKTIICEKTILTSPVHQRDTYPLSKRLQSSRYRIMTDTGGLYHPPDSAASSVYHNDLIRSEIVKAIHKKEDINTLTQFALSSKDGYDSSLRYLQRKVSLEQLKEWRNNPVSAGGLEDS